MCDNSEYKAIKLGNKTDKIKSMGFGPLMHKHPILDLGPLYLF